MNQWSRTKCVIAPHILWCEHSVGLPCTSRPTRYLLVTDSLNLVCNRSLLLGWKCEKWLGRLSNKNQVTMITKPTNLRVVWIREVQSLEKKREKKCWWCHSTKPHRMGNVDLFDKLTGLYLIWTQWMKWFWPLFRFANLWALCKCVDGSISLLVFASQTVILCQQELMSEQNEVFVPKQTKDFFTL